MKGVVELATEDEAVAGIDMQRPAPVGVTTKLLKATDTALRTLITGFTTSIGKQIDALAGKKLTGGGLVTGGGRNDIDRTMTVDAATVEHVRNGTSSTHAVTPKALADVRMLYVVESSEGYKALSDGTVEQWGQAPARGTEGAFSLNFPRPFATECTGVFTTAINRGGAVDGQTTIQEVALFADRADLFLQNHQSTNNDAIGFRWRAWGR